MSMPAPKDQSFTVLTASDPQVKTIYRNGAKGKIPPTTLFKPSVVQWSDKQSMCNLLNTASRYQLIIPGILNPDFAGHDTVQLLTADQHGDARTFLDHPTSWFCLDIDGVPIPNGTGWHDPEQMFHAKWAELEATYPDILRGVGCVWRTSGSSGCSLLDKKSGNLKPPDFRGHFFIPLKVPLLQHDRKLLNKALPIGDQNMWQTGRKHYIGGRICADFNDPLTRVKTSGVIEGDSLLWAATEPVEAEPAVAPTLSEHTTAEGREELELFAKMLASVGQHGVHKGIGDYVRKVGQLVGGGEINRTEALETFWAVNVENFKDQTPSRRREYEHVLDLGIKNPMSVAEMRAERRSMKEASLAEQFSGPSSDYTPEGMSTTPPKSNEDLARTLTPDSDVTELAARVWDTPDPDAEQERLSAFTHPGVLDAVRAAIQKRKNDYRAEAAQAQLSGTPSLEVAVEYQARVTNDLAAVGGNQSSEQKAAVEYGSQHVAAISYFNARYYIVDNHHGQAVVFDGWANDPNAFQPLKDFFLSHIHRKVTTKINKDGTIKQTSAAQFWVEQPEANRFDHSVFDMSKPLGQYVDERGRSVRNFFEGWATTPVHGSWDHIRRYLWEFMCNGQQERYDYVLAYLSQMVCDPMNPTGIMLVWQSEETGTGKGTFFDLVRWMLGKNYVALVDDMDDILGQWTDVLDRCVFVALDEAIVSGDPVKANKLKATLTKPELRINRKNEKQRWVPNLLRIAALTNDDWAVNIHAKDRRTVVMEPRGWIESGVKQGEAAWGPFRREMQREVASFMHHLQTMQVYRDDMPERLETHEHAQQVELSLNGWRKAIFNILKEGKLVVVGGDPSDGWLVNSKSLRDTLNRIGVKVPNNERIEFNKLTPWRRSCVAGQRNVYPVPSLWEAREHFRRACGLGWIDWEDTDPTSDWQQAFE